MQLIYSTPAHMQQCIDCEDLSVLYMLLCLQRCCGHVLRGHTIGWS